MANYNSDSVKVRQVQAAINAAGYTPALVVDGIYGTNTAKGVRWFQQLHGLTVDGIIGDQTMAATIAPAPPAPVPSGVDPLQYVAPPISPPAVPPIIPVPVVALATSTPPRKVVIPIHLPAVAAAPVPVAPVVTDTGLIGPIDGVGPITPPSAALSTVAAPTTAVVQGAMVPAAVGLAVGAGAGAAAASAIPALVVKMAAVGLVPAVPIAAGIGAVVGLLGGLLVHSAMAAKAAAAAAATVHGEFEFDADLESELSEVAGLDLMGWGDELGCDDIIAGDIGMPTRCHSLAG